MWEQCELAGEDYSVVDETPNAASRTQHRHTAAPRLRPHTCAPAASSAARIWTSSKQLGVRLKCLAVLFWDNYQWDRQTCVAFAWWVSAFCHGQQCIRNIDAAERKPAGVPQTAELPQRSGTACWRRGSGAGLSVCIMQAESAGVRKWLSSEGQRSPSAGDASVSCAGECWRTAPDSGCRRTGLLLAQRSRSWWLRLGHVGEEWPKSAASSKKKIIGGGKSC